MTYVITCSKCRGNPDKLINDYKVSYLHKTTWICPHLKVYQSFSKTIWKQKTKEADGQ